MHTEILSTGNEVLTGAVIDSNAAHIAQVLMDGGIEVIRHTCVGDDRAMLVDIMREISRRADAVLVTGGLGPTVDDLTADAAAEAAGVKLVWDEKALAMIEDFFKFRNRPLSESNKKQALLPEGAECIYNPVGTAPGFALKINRAVFYFMPGVPMEMKRMLADAVLPRITALKGDDRSSFRVKNISTFGLPESEVNERLKGFNSRFSELTLGLRAIFPEIHIKIYGKSSDERLLSRQMAEAELWVSEKMGINLLSLEGEYLEAVIGRCLLQRKETLAVAESCTGGLIAANLTNVPGSSGYFLFSGVTYANDAKVNVLGVSPETLKACGAVHERTAEEMALGAMKVAGADWGISTTGIAGPEGGSDEKPVGTVCIGISGPGFSRGLRYHFPFGDRLRNKRIFAAAAMDLLRRQMLKAKMP
jgi:nicotinamide-nucleotide amidase